MEICGHCHNVLSKTVDRCTVCGTLRADTEAADVRRREDGDLPSHAPGWAAPAIPESGIHPEDFLRELAGDEPPSATPVTESRSVPDADSTQAPRSIPSTPAPGALAGYLGTNVDRRPESSNVPTAAPDETMAEPPPPQMQEPSTGAPLFAQHLSTATRVAHDGVAARTTRLDGAVKLGPTPSHRALALGAPFLAGLLLVGGVMGSYRIRASQAAEIEAAEAASMIDVDAVSESSVVRLDLDGCGIIDQTTGFLFANNTILVPQSAVVTDNRPSVSAADGSTWSAEVQGWDLVRNLAIIRPDERIPGGLEWGVSSRAQEGDAVSVLAITGPGVAAPVAANIATTSTLNGANVSFELDVAAAEGSVVLNAEGFVIGVFDSNNLVHVSDDVASAVSRLVLANEQPRAVCPTPTTTTPTTQPPDTEGTRTDSTEGTEDVTPDE